ncbi:P2X receptor A [Diplonema papillatum]|nr:P2X receptor A [Diplonema papillatum]KAJ9456604.1 P2X receptor A [Diplonema papillatum]
MGFFAWVKAKAGEIDADDLFAYKTNRRVVIRDRKLGIARILIIVGLFMYVVVYEVIMQHGYLIKDVPIGFNTLSIRRGGWDSVDPACCTGEGGWCDTKCVFPAAGGGTACEAQVDSAACVSNACEWVESSNETAFGSPRGRLRCVGWDRYNAVHPAAEEYSASITTRVTVSKYRELPVECRLNVSGSSCGDWEEQSREPYFTTGIEDMTIMMAHGVYGQEVERVVMAQEMNKAVLNDANDDVYLSFCGAGTASGRGFRTDSAARCDADDKSRPGDIFSVRELLHAAGVETLDKLRSDGGSSSDTLRYDGLVLLLIVKYDGSGIDSDMRYSMSVKALQGIEFFFEEPLYTTTAGGQLVREVWKRHGLRIVSVASGHVVRFAFAELMKTLVIGMGLMKVASVVVELLIMLLPVSGVYKRYRDVKTIDFSDFDKDKVRDMHDLHFALGEVRTGGPLDPLEEMQLHRVDVPKPSFTKFGDTFNGYNRRASAEGQPGNGKANSSRNNSPSSAVNPKLNQPLLASSLDSRKPSSTTIHATSFPESSSLAASSPAPGGAGSPQGRTGYL